MPGGLGRASLTRRYASVGPTVRELLSHYDSDPVDTESFSAVTVFRGSRRLIVYNDAHVRGRQVSDLCHELSHALLLHPPTPAIDDAGCCDWDPEMEAEADWLCGVLPVTDAAALNIIRQDMSLIAAAAYYGVTPKLMVFRLNTSGARKRIERMGVPNPSRA